MLKVTIIVVVALIVPLFFVLTWIVSIYNNLLVLRSRLKSAFAQVDAHLKHRRDLIPDLVNLAKPACQDAKAAIERLAAARLAAAEARDAVAKTRFDPASVDAFARQEAALPALLADFFNAADVAPELKSLATYHALRQEFATIARSISISIETYNAAVRNLDSACCRFPAKFMCRLLAFKPARPL